MSLWCRLFSHRWRVEAVERRMWRGCDRCGRSEWLDAEGRWTR